MNKYQEAWLNISKLAHKVGTMKEDAQELMEQLVDRVTPKKVVFEDICYDPCRDVLIYGAKCPVCGSVLFKWDDDDLRKLNYQSIEDSFYKNFFYRNCDRLYCERCGHKLDWGNDDEI